jgi:hypothetical protein
MNRKKIQLLICMLSSAILFTTCNTEDIDFDKIFSDINWTPEVKLPIASGEFTVWDLIESMNSEDDTLVQENEEGIVTIVYKEESIVNYNVRELIELTESQNFTAANFEFGELSLEDMSFSSQVTLQELINTTGGPSGVEALDENYAVFPPYSFTGTADFGLETTITEFESIEISEGLLTISFFNGFPVPVTVRGLFYDELNGTAFASFEFNDIPTGQEATPEEINLAGKQTSKYLVFRMTEFSTNGSSPSTVYIEMDGYFKLGFAFSNVKISGGTATPKAEEIDGASGDFTFDFEDDELEINTATLNEGTLTITATNNSQVTGTLHIEMPSITYSGTALGSDIDIQANQTTTQSIDLTDYLIDMTMAAGADVNAIPYAYTVDITSSGPIDFSAIDNIDLSFDLIYLEFSLVTGYFSQQIATIDQGEFSLSMDMWDQIRGDFRLANPAIRLIVTNPVGTPNTVNMNFTAYNAEEGTASLDPDPFSLPLPTSPTQGAVTDTIALDKDNSNIVDFIALPPSDSMTYQGNIVFNPDGRPANDNFLNMDDTITFDMEMNIPLELKLTNVEVINDTSALDMKDMDFLRTAELSIIATNEIPIDIELELAFIDTISGEQYGESVSGPLLTAAAVDENGNITATQTTNEITLDETDIDNMKQANGLVMIGTISSPDNGETVGTLYADSELEIQLSIGATLDPNTD